jgi:hypothetical protein
MLENTARDPLARAKLVAVDNGKIKYKKKHARIRRACESASQTQVSSVTSTIKKIDKETFLKSLSWFGTPVISEL